MGQQLEENDAQRIDIRSPVEPGRVGGDLLRAHVAQGAKQLAGLGSARGRQQVGGGDVGNAEIEHLGLAGFIDQDVAGLEVAMDHTIVVGVLHRVAHLGQQLKARRRVETATAGVLVQWHAADELHGEERSAVFTHPRFMNLSNPSMPEPAQDLGFVAEAADEFGRNEAGADHLEGNGAARVVLFGLVNGAHATFAVLAEDAIAARYERQPTLCAMRR